MKRLSATLVATCLLVLALAAPAHAAFGINNFDVSFTDAEGNPAEAGTHPFAMTTSFGTNFDAELIPEGWLRSISLEQVPGLVGDTTAYPRCTTAEFLDVSKGPPACSLSTQVGITAVSTTEAGSWGTFPVFNITPPPGVLIRLGFHVATQNIYVDANLSQDPPYNAVGGSDNIAQILNFFATKLQLWGDPSDPRHDELRGECGSQSATLPPGDIKGFQFKATGKSCPVAPNPKPFLTMPTSCSEPLPSFYDAISWNDRDEDGKPDTDSGSTLTHDTAGNPQPLFGCGKLRALFNPTITSKPTSSAAQSPTGLDFALNMKDEGLTSVTGSRQPAIRRAVVTLPEGMTANPSLAEGLEVCSEADLDKEKLNSLPGTGCPEASKIGTLEVETPLVDEAIKGSLYIATPYENPFDSLIAFYMVFKNPKLGIIFKQSAKGVPNPKTGQLETITDNIPQTAVFSSFKLHLREGGRSPLVSPPLCGTYETTAEMTSWAGGDPVTSRSSFEVISGPNAGPCPKGGTPPFEPGFEASSLNNAAGQFSPFSMRLTRRDGDQDLTRFDATLPPGVLAKLAGVDKCPDAQIALAKTKTGKAELASPSCPANSKIGTVQAGAGVGSQLTYVPGSVYLAGPFGGAPLSVVGVVPAVAGPFDVGTVITRQALVVHPRSGLVTVDGSKSDPIPHILAGIPLVVRDIQVYANRPNFAINPTNCDPFATKASIWGGGADPFSATDNSPVAREARYQAANCSRLAFKPKLSLKLKGGTKRGDNPRLKSVFTPRSGDANTEGLVVRFPRSAFLDQAHIRTICTRVQYAAKDCPPGSIYGKVRALTPLLSEPLEGPIYLRSSNHNLPDIVFSLHGLVDFEAVGRVDSKKGGIRVTFTKLPDAPITKVLVDMQGGKKGLIVNSTNLCAAKHRANVQLDAQNGKRIQIKPVVQAGCGKKRK